MEREYIFLNDYVYHSSVFNPTEIQAGTIMILESDGWYKKINPDGTTTNWWRTHADNIKKLVDEGVLTKNIRQ